METSTIIAGIVGVVAILIIFREIICWYFKINERNEILRKISEKLGPDPEPEKKDKK